MMTASKIASTIASVLLAFAALGAVLSSAAVVALEAQPGPAINQDGASPGTRSYFDAAGRTSAFGIPAGMSGSVSAGQEIYDLRCATCHGDGARLRAMSYHTYKRRLETTAMAGMVLEEQELADIVAWLNRNQETPAGQAEQL